jgi:YspA, cpYpsA-related SLOG family
MGQPFRLLVTGSRTWHDIAAIERALAVILDQHPEGVLLVHGACPRGTDAIAAAYTARTPGYQIEAHPADWHPVRASCRIPAKRRDGRPRGGRVRSVHPRRDPWQHQHGPAGHSSRYPRLAPHAAMIDPGPDAGYVRDHLA